MNMPWNWTNWKTSAGSVLTFIGAACLVLAEDPQFAKYSAFLALIGSSISGFFARDKNVSDQEAGARRETNPAAAIVKP